MIVDSFSTIKIAPHRKVSIPVTLLGHSAGGITYTRYGKGYEIDKLSEVIQLITYPGLDIQPWKAQVEL